MIQFDRLMKLYIFFYQVETFYIFILLDIKIINVYISNVILRCLLSNYSYLIFN